MKAGCLDWKLLDWIITMKYALIVDTLWTDGNFGKYSSIFNETYVAEYCVVNVYRVEDVELNLKVLIATKTSSF